MITGDKAETALAIGKKCNLITTQGAGRQVVLRMVNLTGEDLRQRVLDLHETVILRRQGGPGGVSADIRSSGLSNRQASVNSVSVNSSESCQTRWKPPSSSRLPARKLSWIANGQA